MKKTFNMKIIFILFPAILLSCEALAINYSNSQSWFIPEHSTDADSRITLCIAAVQADRTGSWDSVEREAASLAPLYFWKQGCRVITADEQPAYAADIQLREREFYQGWRTRRSLAVEVRIWAYEDLLDGVLDQKLPLAAGRVISMGERSFSSSGTTGNMLSKAIQKAVKELAAYERRQ